MLDWLSRRRELAVACTVTILVISLQWSLVRQVKFCGTPDSCAYLALGESLSHHQGFREDFLYQYQFVPHQLPTHGIEYWRPGTSLFLLLAQAFGGVTLHSSLVVELLAGIFLSMAAWRIALSVSGDRRLACASYLLCLMLPQVWQGSVSPDSALLYGGFTAWFLALLRVRFRSYVEDGLALVCVAIVSLIRNDAPLLLVPLLVVLALRRQRHARRGASVRYIALLLAGFGLAQMPMHWIDAAVLGRGAQSQTLGVLCLTRLSQLDSYLEPLTLAGMLHQGWGVLLKLRVMSVLLIVHRTFFVLFGFSAIFLAALWWRGRPRLPELAGGVSFLAVVLGVYGLVLPAIGSFSALRSFAGLLPLLAVLVCLGISLVAVKERFAAAIFAGVLLVYLVLGIRADRRAIAEANALGERDRAVAVFLKAQGVAPPALVMTKDPAQFSETTGYAAVPIPSDGPRAVAQAIRDLRPARILVDDASSATGSRVPGTGISVLAP